MNWEEEEEEEEEEEGRKRSRPFFANQQRLEDMNQISVQTDRRLGLKPKHLVDSIGEKQRGGKSCQLAKRSLLVGRSCVSCGKPKQIKMVKQ